MSNREENEATKFGGRWTREKLGILEKYLDAHTTAVRKKAFKLMYIDAFAGTGSIAPPGDEDTDDIQDLVMGSAQRAIGIDDKPFDKLIFVEENPNRCAELRELRTTHPRRNIVVEKSEANTFLANLDEDWYRWRGVLFLDPFATAVEWSTIEKISGFKALDTWILFPVSAIVRMLPKSRKPDDISPQWVTRLNKVFGDES